jgi:NH3-dependent NAD+ synthetase
MASLLGSKPATPKALAREVKQTTRRSERDIQREIEALNRQEKQVIVDIKTAAKQGNTKTTTIYAKQLLQLRSARDRLVGMKSQVAAAGMQVRGRTLLLVASSWEMVHCHPFSPTALPLHHTHLRATTRPTLWRHKRARCTPWARPRP